MPRRNVLLVNDEIYHIFNKGVASLPIFKSVYDYQRMIHLIDFYRFKNPPLKFSHYNRLPINLKRDFITNLYRNGKRLVEVFSFTLMPNHYHFQLMQVLDDGITKFIGNMQNAYARYFNTKYKVTGSLFQLRFKSVRVESDEQCIHLNRYIHINPLTSYLIKDRDGLRKYKWSSFSTYTGDLIYDFVNTDFILKMFGRKKERFIKFNFDQVGYQRKLAELKRLIFE
ncbi:hypothetical protein A2686_02325 [Candidatus Woesebacteria bacterium RIFCSPHIGHO2_01_FULL_38_10]|uniref:Transposase IS200-like domain-containing protein n=1 Tax=Candidatus Woesebacteria bacterium RIFCSPLOWO2_01_FULL_39_10b TaxID=1802517 RepID=A0A1F8B8R0_9BACT|nr:MAG: hypothetical protein A2686_02325 [Candidatus Woesebacteria bacterium RIFCSPHIGHO2_01_FULL_38_10]OGM60407.1 MAG: hypothetical protein A2892_00010 [Candidatus Woesebacteria bacterium RIFCSPLOWO2_01_FULL_39_10b]